MPQVDYFTNANDTADNKDTNKLSIPLDKNYHKVIRSAVDEKATLKNGYTTYKKVPVGIYGSGPVGTRIRNAVTGIRYDYKVGSVDQDLLYSVALCTGENGLKESVSMFYDSPEQYEKHMFTEIDSYRKAHWHMERN